MSLRRGRDDVSERIMSFDLAGGDLADFEPRLRRENGWSASFARRAIEEYRKFLVLAATARHPVSPSDVVDQVWHLHLLYTRSYWDELCANVLPRPLHHAPSTGAASEVAEIRGLVRQDAARVTAGSSAKIRRAISGRAGADGGREARAKSAAARHRYVDVDANWIIPRVDGVRAAPRSSHCCSRCCSC